MHDDDWLTPESKGILATDPDPDVDGGRTGRVAVFAFDAGSNQ